MKLLICTQAVDRSDPILGFFHRWIEEFSKQCESVMVICLREGEHDLPSNVHVYSLGKEKGRVSRMRSALRFVRLAYSLRDRYDTVLVHMNPEYVVLGGALWRLWGKRVALWYMHKSVDLKLRFATLMVRTIFTASRESFRLPSRKVQIMGHGIDTELFSPVDRTASGTLRLLTVGRVTQAKNIAGMIDCASALLDRGEKCTLSIVGSPVLESDRAYEAEMHSVVRSQGLQEVVRFEGALTQGQLPGRYRHADVFLNLSVTGSMDKAVLEALACGLPAVTSNVAFEELLGSYGLFVSDTDPQLLADVVLRARHTNMAPLAEKVRAEHSLPRLIIRIVEKLSA